MRLLLMLHENPAGSHDDVHRALGRLQNQGTLEAYSVYPYRARMAAGLSRAAVSTEMLDVAEELQPSAILWAHTGDLQVSQTTLDRLLALPSQPVMGYWDGDGYDRFYRPFPRPAREIARRCDVVFVQGLNDIVDSLRRAGSTDIRYVPGCTDDVRYGGALALRQNRDPDYDVVMIGNRKTSRIPFLSRPGARWRAEIVDMLDHRLGTRFAVFGKRWRGPYAKGPIPQAEQGVAYATGRVAVGVNNLHAGYTFSNRLTVAMSCGALIAHNWEVGFDEVFGKSPPLRFFTSTEEAWAALRALLDTDEADLWPERERAREFALSRFTMFHLQEYMTSVLDALRAARAGAGVPAVANPWLARERLWA